MTKVKLIFSIFLLACTQVLSSCVGVHEEKSAEGLVLSVSSPTITIGSGNKLTFSVHLDGEDVTKDTKILYSKQGVNENFELEGNELEPKIPGTFEFTALYGLNVSNKVTVVVKKSGEQGSGVFFRKVAVMYFTGTWCSYCPLMAKAIENAGKENPNRYVTMANHSGDEFSFGPEDELMRMFRITGLPTAVVDFRKVISQSTSLMFTNALKESMTKYPTACGIAIKSELKDGNVYVSVKSKFVETNDYKVCVALVEDEYMAKQNGISTPTYKHMNILRAYANEYDPTTSKTGASTKNFGVSIGKKITDEEYAGDFIIPFAPNANDNNSALTKWNKDKCRVVVYIFNKVDSDYYINNINTCSINGSIDYEYEPEN